MSMECGALTYSAADTKLLCLSSSFALIDANRRFNAISFQFVHYTTDLRLSLTGDMWHLRADGYGCLFIAPTPGLFITPDC